jgi:putative ABC transport system permease protein
MTPSPPFLSCASHRASLLSEGLRPSDTPTRALARRFPPSLFELRRGRLPARSVRVARSLRSLAPRDPLTFIYDPGSPQGRAMSALEALRRDFSLSARRLARSPGFTAAVVVALALAIGANVTVFTLANAFLFKNLPFADSDRIAYVSSRNPRRPGPRAISYPDYRDIRAQVSSFDGAGALTTTTVDLSDETGLPDRYRATAVTPGAFAVIGQRPVRGREFSDADARPGAPPVVILADALWRGRYGSDPAIVGRTVRLNDVGTTVIGVMAPGMTFPGTSDLWLPLVPPATERRDSRTLTMFGRLAPGSTLRAAQSELDIIGARLAAAYPATNQDVGILAQNFNDRYNGGETGRLLFWLLWAVGFVLLIACANVANLLLARAVDRSREISIRASLGATRWHVVRQLLAESLLLAFLGGAAGTILGVWGVRAFDRALVPTVKPAYVDFAVDARVVWYLIAITAGAAIVFGLAPALQLSKLDVNAALKEGGSVAGQSRRARVLSGALVVAEVALAIVLLTGGGLMMRSFVNTTRADIGVDPANILSFNLNLRRTKYPQREDQVRFYEQLKARLESLPGVQTMAVASDLPAESPDDFFYEIEGAPPDDARTRRRAAGLYVGENYFVALGLRPRSGREFTGADGPSAPRLAIVNASLAQRAWPAQDAVGRRFRLVEFDAAGARTTPGPWFTVAGVVPDVLQDDESFELSPVIYLAYRQYPVNGAEVIVRTRVPPSAVGEAIRREVRGLDADLAVRTLRPLEESLWLRNWRHRVFGAMFAIFAIIALVLASVGLYAVVAHAVTQRTREIGVRRTLGATSGSILGLVFRQAFARLGGGLVFGVAGALAATRVLESMLVGVSAADPITLSGVSLVLMLAAGLGCAAPARRAIRVDPLVALRKD